jgi:hypothetical protein
MTPAERDAFVAAVWRKCAPRVPQRLHGAVRPEAYFTDHGDDEESRELFTDAVREFRRHTWPVWAKYLQAVVALGTADITSAPFEARLTHMSFQRRLRRFRLVVERVVPMPALLRGDFEAEVGPVDWAPIRAEVEAHGADPGLGAVCHGLRHHDSLRVWWSRNRRDEALRKAYLNQLLSDLTAMVKPAEARDLPPHVKLIRALVKSGAARRVSMRTSRLRGEGIVTLQDVWDAVHGSSK